ncbi:hypothetical protein [Kribbella shirazensis]|jgi:hypothetical protein|uniref:Uncharacterized protein n=1 Tax=Kribbella shirazensis TaxID=1105143 RepID=A0A7X5V7L4_9ACTN|nr:hypothetical protein [Kribbella shirazensis]NIK56109.1 hypothetical protein [Kribbella shirazensis]
MTTLLYKAAGDIRGDAILPLNQLRVRYPDVYEREVAKYAARPETLRNPVYPLDCCWADVVFLSPVHPAPIFEALHQSGRIGPVNLHYWTVDAELLDPATTCILLKRHDPELRPQPPEDFVPYTPETAAALATPSERALHRLRNLDATEPLYPWADIPHILHRGPIPLAAFRTPSGAPVIS